MLDWIDDHLHDIAQISLLAGGLLLLGAATLLTGGGVAVIAGFAITAGGLAEAALVAGGIALIAGVAEMATGYLGHGLSGRELSAAESEYRINTGIADSVAALSILVAAFQLQDQINQSNQTVASTPDEKGTTGGRWGNAGTRAKNGLVGEVGEEVGTGKVTNGGGMYKEEYLRPLEGGRKGGNYIDITFTRENPDGTVTVTRVNTVDTYANGMPTAREQAAAEAINIKLDAMGDSHIILIPKNATYEDIIKYLLGEE